METYIESHILYLIYFKFKNWEIYLLLLKKKDNEGNNLNEKNMKTIESKIIL